MVKVISLVLVLLVFFTSCGFDSKVDDIQQHYPYQFSPLNGVVSGEELPYRSEVCLNGKWNFMPVYPEDVAEFTLPSQFKWDSVQIKIPSPWNVNSDGITFPSYPEKWEKATIGWMQHRFVVPGNWNKKIIKLHFEGIAGLSKIYINGTLAGESRGVPFPTEIDATSLLKKGENEVIVGVAKKGQHFAGIWQDVHLVAYPELAIDNISIDPDVNNNELVVVASIRNYSNIQQHVSSTAVVRAWKRESTHDINDLPLPGGVMGAEVLNFSTANEINIAPGAELLVTLKQKVDGQLDTWTPQHPNLYGLTVELNSNDDPVDKKFVRFGWRQFTIDGTHLLLNGKRIVLKGDSWHFMGVPQMTRRYAYAWFQMLKDVNANAVRLHDQPYPSFYLDVADEMGICVLDETSPIVTSIFHSVEYNLKPLALGLSDTTRAPNLNDGIFFPEFREGVPGVQPERLGPYTSTFNPGYDRRLPLYRPTASSPFQKSSIPLRLYPVSK